MPGISWGLTTSCDPTTIPIILSWPLIHKNAESQRLIPVRGFSLSSFSMHTCLTESQVVAISCSEIITLWLSYFTEQARNADAVLYAYIIEQYDLTVLSVQFTKPLAVQITLITM